MEMFNYLFTLHCKGKQEDINVFKERVKKASDDGDIDLPPPNDKDDSPASLEFTYEESPWDFEAICDDLLPLMKEFTKETGKPISFFFEIDTFLNVETNSQWFGYVIYDGTGEKIDSDEFHYDAEDYRVEDEDGNIDDEASEEKMNEAMGAEYKLVTAALEAWLKK
jgi:hypothetical protein